MTERDSEPKKFITKEEIPLLTRLCLKAMNEEKPEFLFKGEVVLTQFAKYVIQQMGSKI